MALILALPGLALAEEDAELVILPEQETAAEGQDGPELDVEGGWTRKGCSWKIWTI